MKIAMASDVEGSALKTALVDYLLQKGYEVIDKGGGADAGACAAFVAVLIASGEAGAGILISATGIGVTIAANGFPGIRACVCPDTYAVGRGVSQEDMNVLCLGAGSCGVELSKELAMSFIKAILLREGPARDTR